MPGFESLSKSELHRIADRLLVHDRSAIATAVDFIAADTEGLWHGRGRSMMCRRLKHCPLDPRQRDRLVDCIAGRLNSGHFAEQFRDQLRLALQLDRQTVLREAIKNLAFSPKQHVRRYSAWTLRHYGNRQVTPV